MGSTEELGDFLAACRARLRPEDVGLAGYGERRRVSGLRREEVAQLAGVSPSYYRRLEQGESRNASVEVLDALARALALVPDERAHLHSLARGARGRRAVRRPTVERCPTALGELLRALGDVPAVVTGRRGDVLAWNQMGHALYAGHLDPDSPQAPAGRPNTARMVFLDAHTRELYVDWPAKARAVVEHLRLVVGNHPDDPLLASLVGELTMGSAQFARLWADHRVRACDVATYDLRHPSVGSLTITQQTLHPAYAPECGLVTSTATGGSSAELLRMLAGLAGLAADVARQALVPQSHTAPPPLRRALRPQRTGGRVRPGPPRLPTDGRAGGQGRGAGGEVLA